MLLFILMSQFCLHQQLTVFELIANYGILNSLIPWLRLRAVILILRWQLSAHMDKLWGYSPQHLRRSRTALLQCNLIFWRSFQSGNKVDKAKEVETTKKRNKETTTTTMKNNKMNKRMTHSVRRWHRSPATIAGNRAATVLFRALMIWAPWVIGCLEHCSREVPFLAEGHRTCCTTGRLWTPINYCNLHCSGSPVQLVQPMRQPRQVLWAVPAVDRLEAELMTGKTTNNKQARWPRLLQAFTSSLQYMNAWLTNKQG